jgi:hypothetical protein
MIALYWRQARTWEELELGTLRPLDELLPEMTEAAHEDAPDLAEAPAIVVAPIRADAAPENTAPASTFGPGRGPDWSHPGELNPRPAVYETAALPLS